VAELEKSDLKLYALYVGCHLTKDTLVPDAGLPEAIAALKGHGTVIWLYTQSRDFTKSDEAGDAVAVPGFQKIADLAAESGLRVAIYPHLGMWTERLQDGLRLARKVNRPNFGVSFNLCHCLAAGDGPKIPQLLQEARPYLFMVTLNGADAGGKGWGQLIQPLGRGSFDVVPVLRTLRDIGYKGPIGFQAFGIKGDRRALLSGTIQAWRKLSAEAAQP
jgi:sugar phosphate isomerase/epimerase